MNGLQTFLEWAGVTNAPVATTIGEAKVFLEVANDTATRTRGLMGRQWLLPDHGMLFAFPKCEVQHFWMDRTPLDLSVGFIKEDGELFEVRDLTAMSREIISSSAPCRYAIEMKRGWFDHNCSIPCQVDLSVL